MCNVSCLYVVALNTWTIELRTESMANIIRIWQLFSLFSLALSLSLSTFIDTLFDFHSFASAHIALAPLRLAFTTSTPWSMRVTRCRGVLCWFPECEKNPLFPRSIFHSANVINQWTNRESRRKRVMPNQTSFIVAATKRYEYIGRPEFNFFFFHFQFQFFKIWKMMSRYMCEVLLCCIYSFNITQQHTSRPTNKQKMFLQKKSVACGMRSCINN